jgi:polysaccharide deacetylase 2 family uncharacterized protein YibQ
MAARNQKKNLNNRRGKASKPNLAVVVLLLIVIVQGFLLFKANSHKSKTAPAKKPVAQSVVKTPEKKIVLPKPIPEPIEIPEPVVVIPEPKPTPPLATTAKIVIIIDDSGYKSRDCDHLADIDVPVTISILPNLAYSKKVAECASVQGKEVMLHMPLEPHIFREKYPEDYFIKTNMSSTQITKRFAEALKSVPHVKGINNHEGSKATEDSRVMYLIFKELAKKNLFFVDSKVTSKSVCRPLADKMGLPFASRDVFLDNVNERAAIEKQFTELAAKAREQGTAVAIGHARELSWEVMTEQIKILKAQGFQFITVQQLINSKSR